MKYFYIPFVAFPLISIATVFASDEVKGSDEDDFGLEPITVVVTQAATKPVVPKQDIDAEPVEMADVSMNFFPDMMVAKKYPNQQPSAPSITHDHLLVPADSPLKKPDEGKASSGAGGALAASAKVDS